MSIIGIFHQVYGFRLTRRFGAGLIPDKLSDLYWNFQNSPKVLFSFNSEFNSLNYQKAYYKKNITKNHMKWSISLSDMPSNR